MANRKVFRVEMYVSAENEKAVWLFLKQLKTVDDAGLDEEPSVYDVDEENENG